MSTQQQPTKPSNPFAAPLLVVLGVGAFFFVVSVLEGAGKFMLVFFGAARG